MFGWNEGAVSGVFGKDIFQAYLLESQHLFEILQTSLTAQFFFFFFFFFFEMKEGYKVSCVKILVLLEGIITEIIRRSAFI